MAIITNAGSLADGMQRRTNKYLKEVRGAVKDNTRLVYKKARQFSAQRWWTPEQLRKAGHPFAALRPAWIARAHRIARQSGSFYRAWHWNFIAMTDGAKGTIWNASGVARFMNKTVKMIARPILTEALKRTKGERNRNIKNARRRGYYRVTGR